MALRVFCCLIFLFAGIYRTSAFRVRCPDDVVPSRPCELCFCDAAGRVLYCDTTQCDSDGTMNSSLEESNPAPPTSLSDNQESNFQERIPTQRQDVNDKGSNNRLIESIIRSRGNLQEGEKDAVDFCPQFIVPPTKCHTCICSSSGDLIQCIMDERKCSVRNQSGDVLQILLEIKAMLQEILASKVSSLPKEGNSDISKHGACTPKTFFTAGCNLCFCNDQSDIYCSEKDCNALFQKN